MCGICGMSWKDEKLCKGMAKTLAHRGPDDEGFYFDKNVSLGHRRLSIIDLECGHQPMHNEDKSVWIVYNGEIYNYKELREELKDKYKFITNSDTEVMIHAYEEWDTDCVKRFNGMWAFCIFDRKKNALFLSRDRFGVKPLYYHMDKKGIIFASEIKALLPYVKAVPNEQTIYNFLLTGTLERGEETFFGGIKRLLPATSIVFSLGKKSIEKSKYWDITRINKDVKSKKGNGYAQEFKRLLTDSVRLRLIADVPVGTCLSGGLDSSAIVCLANEMITSEGQGGKKRQKTFSAVYKEAEADESEYVEEIVRKTGVDKKTVYPSGQELFNELEKVVYHQDEPFGSTSIYAQWNVMRLAKKDVKVLLDGQGSDELLAGYMGFFVANLRSLWAKKKILRLVKEGILCSDLLKSLLWAHVRQKSDAKKLMDPKFASRFKAEKVRYRGSGGIAEESYSQLTGGGLQELLRYEDRDSMAFSIESRVPFLDYRIAEYVFSLPEDQRISNGWTKRVLRDSMKGVLPERIRLRRKKLGFATPEEKWLRDNKEKILEIFDSKSFRERGYFNAEEVISAFKDFCNGANYKTGVFWRLISLEMWFRVFIDKK